MSDKVVNIKEPVVFVQSLEEILKQAKAGELRGCVMFYEDKEGCCWIFHGYDAQQALGGCARLMHKLNEVWDDAY